MLHGFTQSGHVFEIKTKALKKSLEKAFPPAPKPGHLARYPGGVDLSFPTAPHRLLPIDLPGFPLEADGGNDQESPEAYGWWKRKGDGEPYECEGMEKAWETIATVLKEEGPFDAAVGFSQGGAAAGMLAALLEKSRWEAFQRQECRGGMPYPEYFREGQETIHPPFKFAVSYSGFAAGTHPLYKAFYEPKIVTPMLHFIGSVDTVVSEERSLRLVDACVDGRGKDGESARLVYHPGGHFLPSSQKQYVAALVAFMREVVGEHVKTEVKQERVEDMDVPF